MIGKIVIKYDNLYVIHLVIIHKYFEIRYGKYES